MGAGDSLGSVWGELCVEGVCYGMLLWWVVGGHTRMRHSPPSPYSPLPHVVAVFQMGGGKPTTVMRRTGAVGHRGCSAPSSRQIQL